MLRHFFLQLNFLHKHLLHKLQFSRFSFFFLVFFLLLFIMLYLVITINGLAISWSARAAKIIFITVTRRPHHPNIAACLYCLATSPGFLPILFARSEVGSFTCIGYFSWDRRLKVSSKRPGNEDKAPCPRALLPGRGSNRGPPVWKSEALTARPRQLSGWIVHVYKLHSKLLFWRKKL